jgi:hypothetical protein
MEKISHARAGSGKIATEFAKTLARSPHYAACGFFLLRQRFFTRTPPHGTLRYGFSHEDKARRYQRAFELCPQVLHCGTEYL